jgi:polyphenol oxidase
MSDADRLPEALTADWLPTRHGFFSRRGGVSEGPFSSLNCSMSGRDDPAAVMENRARVAAALDVLLPGLVGLTQVHGTEVVTVAKPWESGAGPRADGMVTDRPGIALSIVTADCAPVFLLDEGAGVIGAAHAGWRGAVAGILEATLAAMVKLGAAPRRVVAAIGPCIAQSSYEVGADVEAAVLARDPARLLAAGVAEAAWLGIDTLADEARFFSHRRRTLAGGAPIGHQISAIVL